MTREEAKQDLQLLIEFYNNDSGSAPLCLEYCLNMLEQEPCEDAIHRDRIVQDFADKCRECGREKVLDKIRAEIENHCGLAKENHCRYCSWCNNKMGVREMLEIIDKYKESEG